MKKITIIGLGYVGLPLAIEFGKKFNVLGFDISKSRIFELKKGLDSNGEFTENEILHNKIQFTHTEKDVGNSDFYIITVPTPLKKNNEPDLRPLKSASQIVGKKIKKGDIVIYESTVYPGVTENICIPIIEKNCAFKNGKDFFVGYSPERVNPGDKKHQLNKINKILAYPYDYKKRYLLKLYSLIGKKIILTKNIKEAETAKVIENICIKLIFFTNV